MVDCACGLFNGDVFGLMVEWRENWGLESVWKDPTVKWTRGKHPHWRSRGLGRNSNLTLPKEVANTANRRTYCDRTALSNGSETLIVFGYCDTESWVRIHSKHGCVYWLCRLETLRNAGPLQNGSCQMLSVQNARGSDPKEEEGEVDKACPKNWTTVVPPERSVLMALMCSQHHVHSDYHRISNIPPLSPSFHVYIHVNHPPSCSRASLTRISGSQNFECNRYVAESRLTATFYR
jgi:hypothetical protein